jgi:hypothetical protein
MGSNEPALRGADSQLIDNRYKLCKKSDVAAAGRRLTPKKTRAL